MTPLMPAYDQAVDNPCPQKLPCCICLQHFVLCSFYPLAPLGGSLQVATTFIFNRRWSTNPSRVRRTRSSRIQGSCLRITVHHTTSPAPTTPARAQF